MVHETISQINQEGKNRNNKSLQQSFYCWSWTC